MNNTTIDYLDYFDEYLNRNSDEYEIPNEEFEGLIEQYKFFRRNYTELKEENDKLKEELECRNSTWETKEGEYEGEILELKEENEQLNSKLIYTLHQKKIQRDKLYEFKDEINALNEEHRKLKEQYKYL
jgi:predicted  nucleic acid-binding Zn-ribbon protein